MLQVRENRQNFLNSYHPRRRSKSNIPPIQIWSAASIEGRRGKGARMEACRRNAGCCWVKPSLISAVCAILGLETLCALALAQDTSPQGQILLMYGDGRIELYPRPQTSEEQLRQPLAVPHAESYPPDGPRAVDLRVRAGSSRHRDTHDPFEYRPSVGIEVPSRGDLGESYTGPRESANCPGDVRSPWTGQVQWESLRGVPFEEADGPVPPFPPLGIDKAGKPVPGADPSHREPAMAAAVIEEAHPQAQLSTLPPPPGPITTRERDGSPGDDRKPGPSADLVTTAVVQVLGTLVGLFIGLPVCAAVFWFVLRRFRSQAPAPVIRLELANPPYSAGSVPWANVASEAGKNSLPVPKTPVPVVDFRDQCIAFNPLGKTYDQEQRAKAERTKQRETEVLQQIVAENVALREKISGQVSAA